jgi:hypothetical protein
MATDDYTLGQEARVQTGKTGSTPSDDNLRTLIGRAKREIEGETGLESIDWYGDVQAERALFWLTCIFLIGETTTSSEGFAVGDLEVRASSGSTDFDPLARYRHRYDKALRSIGTTSSGSGFGITNLSRADRDYDFDSRVDLR